ncbi:MAG: hypothetical protein LBF41_02060 [Deltaproteobacteria bacterium]|jgi:hypothetical protein|nr:hypothetical protein [Deltaproteobacteria bacterium]
MEEINLTLKTMTRNVGVNMNLENFLDLHFDFERNHKIILKTFYNEIIAGETEKILRCRDQTFPAKKHELIPLADPSDCFKQWTSFDIVERTVWPPGLSVQLGSDTINLHNMYAQIHARKPLVFTEAGQNRLKNKFRDFLNKKTIFASSECVSLIYDAECLDLNTKENTLKTIRDHATYATRGNAEGCAFAKIFINDLVSIVQIVDDFSTDKDIGDCVGAKER